MVDYDTSKNLINESCSLEEGKLFVVSTPIGNLEDITLRALNVLKEVDVIAAEDTRHTSKLLRHFSIQTKLISYHEHNEESKSELILKLIKNGKNVALVSDAGTPMISDPGYVIVRSAIKENIEVIPVPGVTACIAALVSSGLSSDFFTFVGFLPRQKSKRTERLKELSVYRSTLVFYEAPHRLLEMMESLVEVIGDRKCALVKEITKKFESTKRGFLSDVINEVKQTEVKGEYVIIVDGAEIEDVVKEKNKRHKNKYYEYSKVDVCKSD